MPLFSSKSDKAYLDTEISTEKLFLFDQKESSTLIYIGFALKFQNLNQNYLLL